MGIVEYFMDELDKVAQLGFGGPPLGRGGEDICVCPECGFETVHARGKPCRVLKCPECGATMVGPAELE